MGEGHGVGQGWERMSMWVGLYRVGLVPDAQGCTADACIDECANLRMNEK